MKDLKILMGLLKKDRLDFETVKEEILDLYNEKKNEKAHDKQNEYKTIKWNIFDKFAKSIIINSDKTKLLNDYENYISERQDLKKIYKNLEDIKLTNEVIEAKLDLKQFEQNINSIKSEVGKNVKFMAVLKGNAYGHGLREMAKAAESFGCDSIGVVRVNEAYQIRKQGIKTPVQLLAPILPEQAEWAVKNDVTPMVDNYEILDKLQESAKNNGKVTKVHVKINTGLNRYGILPDEAKSFFKNIKANYPNIEVEGVYTHFKDAEGDMKFTKLQIDRFNKVLDELKSEGLRPKLAHASASGAILLHKNAHYDMVRCGLILYGLELGDDIKLPKGVKSIMSIESKVLSVKDIKSGESCGYIDRFIAKRDSKIATIAGGYGDGLSRGWKEVMIGGVHVPVVNYCMDAMQIDVTDLKNPVKIGDRVTVVGKQDRTSISWEKAGNNINTLTDELTQRITSRVNRVALEK